MAIVKAMERLEERELIERSRSQKDGRRISVHLTCKGKTLKNDVIHFATEVQNIALEDVSQATLSE